MRSMAEQVFEIIQPHPTTPSLFLINIPPCTSLARTCGHGYSHLQFYGVFLQVSSPMFKNTSINQRSDFTDVDTARFISFSMFKNTSINQRFDSIHAGTSTSITMVLCDMHFCWMCLSAQHLVGIDIGAVVGLLAHGSSGSPRGRSETPESTFPPARRASSGMQDTDFPFTVARAAPVLHRVPVHRSRRSITSTQSAWSPRRVRFRSGRTSARRSTAATRPRPGCGIRASSTAG